MESKGEVSKCRTCLTTITQVSSVALFIKAEDQQQLSLGEKLIEFTSLQIDLNDTLSKNVCYECKENIQNSYNFKKQCEHSYTILKYEQQQKYSSDLKFIVDSEVSENEDEDYDISDDFKDNTTNLTVFNPYEVKPAKNKSSNCRACNTDMGDIKRLQAHIHEIHPGEVSCDICNKMFPNFKKFNQHMYDSHEYKNPQKCPFCIRVFPKPYLIRRHIMKEHRKEFLKNLNENNNDDKNTITNSNVESENLAINFENSFDIKIYEESLDKIVQSTKILDVNLQPLKLYSLKPKLRATPSTVCRACNIDMKEYSYLRKHIEAMHPGDVNCLICSMTFPVYTKLSTHFYDYHLRGNIKCLYCDQKFSRPIYANKHIVKTHRQPNDDNKWNEEIDYFINDQQSFANFSDKDYEDTFEDIEPTVSNLYEHKCLFCDKIYTKSNLTEAHMIKMHFTEYLKSQNIDNDFKDVDEVVVKKIKPKVFNPYVKRPPKPPTTICRACNVDVCNIRNMTSHVLECHPGEVACRICKKVFSNFRKFNSHMYDCHEYKRPQKCPFCDKVYSKVSLIKKHIRANHRTQFLKNLVKNNGNTVVDINNTNVEDSVTTINIDDTTEESTPENGKEILEEKNEIYEVKTNDGTTVKQLKLYTPKPKARAPATTICRACDVDLKKHKLLRKHIEDIHPGEVTCLICGKILPNYRKLCVHTYDNHSPKKEEKHKCLYCDRQFSKVSHVNKHIIKVHGEKNKQQSDEERRKTSAAAPIQQPSTFYCHLCKISFGSNKSLDLHVKRLHSAGVNCPFCGMALTDYRKLNQHIYECHIYKKEYKCLLCPRLFVSSMLVNKHIARDHPNDGKFFKKATHNSVCQVCQTDQGTYKDYLVHVKTEHSGDVDCLTCGKTFSKYKKLVKHIHDAHQKKKVPFQCEYCDRSYSAKRILNIHIANVHKTNDPEYKQYRDKYLCPICGNEFQQKQNLRNHMRLHTGEKPYKCTICSKTFIQKSSLNNHSLFHSRIKNYACEVCGMKFVYRSAYRVHKQRLHEVRPWIYCEMCDNKYHEKKTLKEHYESVHLGIKHKCQVCGREFSYKKGLRYHFLKEHKEIKKIDS